MFKSSIKKILPYPIYNILSWIHHPQLKYRKAMRVYHEKKIIKKQPLLHKKALEKLHYKQPIKCVFFALFDSVWKCDGMYLIMEESSFFDPIILVCPIINLGRDNMLQKMDECYNMFKEKGYNVIKSYDINNDSYVDVTKEIDPDIIIYTNPYKGLIDDRYYISNFKDKLTIYMQYYYGANSDDPAWYNLEMHNLSWRYYVETEAHKQFHITKAKNKGRNVVVTGYPGIENLLYGKTSKKSEEKRKVIIWAPHHSIEPVGIVNYSTFLTYAAFMFEMARKYEKEAYFVFKPHPLLRNKLEIKWGKEKTDKYYHQWENLSNTRMENGDYIHIFNESDAMIHDSASFVAEYLYTGKPVMRIYDERTKNSYEGPFWKGCLSVYYKAYNEQDIEQFIQNVIDGVDPMKEARERFYQERLLPPNGKLPSENIVNDIIDSIKNQRVLAE